MVDEQTIETAEYPVSLESWPQAKSNEPSTTGDDDPTGQEGACVEYAGGAEAIALCWGHRDWAGPDGGCVVLRPVDGAVLADEPRRCVSPVAQDHAWDMPLESGNMYLALLRDE